jgi:precorrin-6A synthase
MQLFLIGIGSGNPDHLTLQAVKAINAVDLILIPRKGAGKEDLADLRRAILDDVLTNRATKVVEFDLPVRDETVAEYTERVSLWHDAIAGVWSENIGGAEKVALLVWGDPSLYDSTLRIAARLSPAPQITVIPGITSIQALTAGHAIPLNDLAEPVTITTGRQLRDHGFPMGVKACVVMLDGACSFQTLPQEGLHIWWAGYAGMAQEIRLSGPLAETGPRIIAARAKARAEHGWIMDIYLLRRKQG